ncbi:MFS transporter [Pseudonocardia benzenivorans]
MGAGQRAVHRHVPRGHRGLGQRRLRRRDRAVRDGTGHRHRVRPAARRPARHRQLARPVLRGLRAHADRAGGDRRARRTHAPARPTVLLREPITALRHRSLATTSVTGLLYNWGFFTLLGYSPFLLDLSALQLGGVFFAWGILVALFAVFGATMLKNRVGTLRSLYGALGLIAVILLLIGLFPGNRLLVMVAVIVSGAAVGLNNTLVTTAVMSISPVPRNVASATYGFVRFIGGGLAPFVAGLLAEHVNVQLPFLIGAGAVVVGALLLHTVRRALDDADAEAARPAEDAAAEQAVGEVPAVAEEAVLAEDALRREHHPVLPGRDGVPADMREGSGRSR